MIPDEKARRWRTMALAREAIELGARVSIAAAFTGLPKYEVQRLFCDTETPGVSSGRQPWSAGWYLTESVVVEIQAAYFYACFRQIRELGYPAADALVSGYKNYRRNFGHDPRLSFDRAFELITHVEGLWSTKPPCLMTVVCHACKSTRLMLRADEPVGTGECPFCKVARTRNAWMLKTLVPSQSAEEAD